VDYKKDLGFKDVNRFNLLFNFWKNESVRFSLGYTYMSDQSSKTLEKPITFMDANFHTGDVVDTDLSLHLLSFSWAWNFLSFSPHKNVKVEAGSIVKLDTYILGIGMKANSGTEDKLSTVPVPYPAVGVNFETTIYRYTSVFGEFSGLYLGDLAGFIDINTGVRVHPHKNVSIELAYKLLSLNSTWDKDSAEAAFGGITFGIIGRY